MDELLLKLKPFGQDHLLQFCDQIKADEKKKFEKDLSEVDYAYVKNEFETCQKELEGQQNVSVIYYTFMISTGHSFELVTLSSF